MSHEVGAFLLTMGMIDATKRTMASEHPNGPAPMTQPRNMDAAARRQMAVRLRVQGKSYRVIAKTLECSVSAAHGYIKSEMDDLRDATRADAEHLRDIEIAKLDSLEDKCRSKLRHADEQDTAKLAAVIVKITESRRKLLGLDAPQRVEMSGNLYTVKEASPECSEWGEPAAKKED